MKPDAVYIDEFPALTIELMREAQKIFLENGSKIILASTPVKQTYLKEPSVVWDQEQQRFRPSK